MMQRTIRAAAGRRRLAGPHAGRGDPGGHVAGRQEPGVGRVDDAAQRLRPGRRGQQRLQPGRLPGAGPGTHAFLQQPQAHHVPQVPDRPVDPRFVAEIRPAAGLGEHRLIQLHAHQRPRPAGDVGEAAAAGGHGDHGGRGVVRADGDDGEPGSQARASRRAGLQEPDQLAGLAQRGEDARRDSGLPDQPGGPGPGGDVVQLRGRCVRDLGAGLPGQPVAEQVGDEQQRRRPR